MFRLRYFYWNNNRFIYLQGVSVMDVYINLTTCSSNYSEQQLVIPSHVTHFVWTVRLFLYDFLKVIKLNVVKMLLLGGILRLLKKIMAIQVRPREFLVDHHQSKDLVAMQQGRNVGYWHNTTATNLKHKTRTLYKIINIFPHDVIETYLN